MHLRHTSLLNFTYKHICLEYCTDKDVLDDCCVHHVILSVPQAARALRHPTSILQPHSRVNVLRDIALPPSPSILVTMSSIRFARAALRARPAAFRVPIQRRTYAEAVSDKLKLSLALPHQVRY